MIRHRPSFVCTLLPLSPNARDLIVHLESTGCKYAKGPNKQIAGPNKQSAGPEESKPESGDSSATIVQLINSVDDVRIELRMDERKHFLFGRGSGCDVTLTKGKLVSRKHFWVFLLDKDVLMLENLSRNSTYVNYDPVHERQALSDGNIITIIGDNGNDLIFLVKIPAVSDAIPPNHRNSTTAAQTKEYMLQESLGAGKFGLVHRAIEVKTGEIFAVKEIKIGTTGMAGTYLREADVLQRLKHGNIISYSDSFFNNGGKFSIVIEFTGGGNLHDYIRERDTMNETMVQKISRQLLSGIVYMHSMDIVHRDLKPENILIFSENPLLVKISDFGLAKKLQSEDQQTFCGTMLYLAPEVYPGYNTAVEVGGGSSKRKRNPKEDDGRREAKLTKRYMKAADMWSLGCVIYVLLIGKSAFEGEYNANDMLRLILKGLSPTAVDGLHQVVTPRSLQNAKAFIGGLLQVDPLLRMTPDDALKHVWLERHEETDDVRVMPGSWPEEA